MKFGLQMFPTDYAIKVTELGRAAEDLGFDSLFFPEHTHIPTSRRTPWPGGAPLPKEYSHTLDPFVAMTATMKRSCSGCELPARANARRFDVTFSESKSPSDLCTPQT